MYSVVLVMALAGSADAVDCNCGFCGCQVQRSCFGCQGCYGGCQGCYGGCQGRVGCYGCQGCFGGCQGRVGCYGCQGGFGCQGCYGGAVLQPVPRVEAVPAPAKKDAVNGPMPGTIVVSLPAEATLSIDGYVSTQTSSVRQLTTPPIQPGQEFTYTLVAETTQNGQRVSKTETVTVRAGQRAPVTFNFTAATPVVADR